jgi:dihydroorotate dehydrogenase (NAD+) catalytic subunit
MGGIASAEDVVEFMLAGANAVQIGTANFADPFIWARVLADLEAYDGRHGVTRLADLVGAVETGKTKAPEPACRPS